MKKVTFQNRFRRLYFQSEIGTLFRLTAESGRFDWGEIELTPSGGKLGGVRRNSLNEEM